MLCKNNEKTSKNYLNDVLVRTTLVWLAVFCVFQKYFVHIGASVLKQFIGAVEDNHRYFAVTQYAQFIRFLHQAKLPLCKGHLKRHSSFNTEHNQYDEPEHNRNRNRQF